MQLPIYIATIVKKYDLPYDERLVVDSNGLVFYYSGRFDTTFLVHLRKNGPEIKGVLYEVLPAFHRDDVDYADKKKQLLFFEGYSFRLDSLEWREIVNQARGNLLTHENRLIKNEGCADCPFYFLAHDFKVIKSDVENRSLFGSYSRYLKDFLLRQFEMKRRYKVRTNSK